MSAGVGPADISDFREVLAGRFGLSLQGVRTDVLVELLERRLAGYPGPCAGYLAWLADGGSRAARQLDRSHDRITRRRCRRALAGLGHDHRTRRH